MKRKETKNKKAKLTKCLKPAKVGNMINVTLLEQKWFSSNNIKFDLFREENFPEANFPVD